MVTNIQCGRLGLALLAILLLVAIPATATQQLRADFEGMWSDPPATAVGTFCSFALHRFHNLSPSYQLKDQYSWTQLYHSLTDKSISHCASLVPRERLGHE